MLVDLAAKREFGPQLFLRAAGAAPAIVSSVTMIPDAALVLLAVCKRGPQRLHPAALSHAQKSADLMSRFTKIARFLTHLHNILHLLVLHQQSSAAV